MRTIRALIRPLLVGLTLLVAVPALAQSVPAVVSPGPDSVAVAIYRDSASQYAFDLNDLRGYALITERRTIRIPAARSLIRFEGVAGGILPESAVVSGLPDGVLEKNLDADLLSPRSLYARTYGRPVTLTHRNANGTMVSERAIIRSGPDGAAIFETKDGFITADCTGHEAIVYDDVPEGLSAKPTLSIETNSAEAHDVTITLSYLAWGFDWQVNYVATMRPDGKSADLVAWATLANSDVTSFTDAETMLVAGTVSRDEDSDSSEARDRFDTDQSLTFECTSSHVERFVPLPAPPPLLEAEGGEDIVVVSRSANSVVDSITAVDLGDVKLYRIPDRTTVASNSQKQVLLFDRPAVPVDVIFRAGFALDDTDIYDVRIVMRWQNRKERGLGIPLPGGGVALFEPLGERRLLVGEGRLWDRAVGEDIDIEMGDAVEVRAVFEPAPPKRGWEDRVLVATNANPYPVRFEARIDFTDYDLEPEARLKQPRPRADAPLTYRGTYATWAVAIPANSSVRLRLRK